MSMKTISAKGIQTEMSSPFGHSQPASGYVTEKMYLLLQIYLQQKGWNQVDLLQYMADLKEGPPPSPAFVQIMTQRIGLDAAGRLILRDNGKIILPFEHFANAVMLKHMNGPHQGIHLGLEATVRAVMESYTIGRENFGMEKDFIMEVVNNCPNPACRYYKSHLDLGHHSKLWPEQSQPTPSVSKSKGKRVYVPKEQDMTDYIFQGSSGQEGNLDMKGTPLPPSQSQQKLTESQMMMLKSSGLDNLDNLNSSNKDLFAVHHGAWSSHEEVKRNAMSNSEIGQEKIVRGYSEIMNNMSRIRSYIRPAMCKPYGKQSESLQKTIVDTLQMVQSLRTFLPPPHIQVSSWKNEDKHRKSVNVSGLEDLCESARKLDH